MKIYVGNVESRIVIGGKDYLLGIDIETSLRDYMKVRPNGYNHSIAYRKHRWDGYRHFITKSMKFATGFLPYIWKYSVQLGLEVEIIDERGELPKFKEEFEMQIGDWTLRDYQADMVKAVQNNYVTVGSQSLYFPRGIIDAATNAGKTSAIAGIFNNMEKPKALFLLSRKDAFNQMVEYFSTMYRVGMVCSGVTNFTDFTVAMVKTLYGKVKKKDMNVLKELASINLLIVDECHNSSSSEYSELLQSIKSGVRVFVSGTPLDHDDKVNGLVIVGLSGPVVYKVSNKELISKGVSLRPIVHMLLASDGFNVASLAYRENYERFVEFSEHRLQLIGDIIEEHSDKQILVTFKNKEHGKFLCEGLTERFPHLKDEFAYVHSESPNRESSVEAFKKNRLQVLIASMILKESMNIPNIQVLIMAHGGKSHITLKQFIGRAIRDDGESSEVLVYDFFDEGKWVSSHSKKRLSQYREEEFEIIYHYPATKLGSPKKSGK